MNPLTSTKVSFRAPLPFLFLPPNLTSLLAKLLLTSAYQSSNWDQFTDGCHYIRGSGVCGVGRDALDIM